MSIYRLDDYGINALTRTSVALRNVVRPFCRPEEARWKARREYFADILVPDGGDWDRKMYVYVKIPANELWLLPVEQTRNSIRANGFYVPSRVLQGETCYFVTEADLKKWSIAYRVLSVPMLEDAILKGPWEAA